MNTIVFSFPKAIHPEEEWVFETKMVEYIL